MVAKQQPRGSAGIGMLVVAAACLLAVPLGLLGLPFGLVVAAAVWWAGRDHPAPELTGRDSERNPAPANESERVAEHTWRVWRATSTNMLNPFRWWGNGATVALACGLAGAGLAAMAPAFADWVRLVNAACVAAVVLGRVSALEQVGEHGRPCPGVKLSSLPLLWRGGPVKPVLALLGGALAGFAAAVGLAVLAKSDMDAGLRDLVARNWDGVPPQVLAPTVVPAAVWVPSMVAVGGLWALWPLWDSRGLARWRELVAADVAWKVRWGTIAPKQQVPELVSHEKLGGAVVDVFDTGGVSAANVWLRLADQMDRVLPGVEVFLLSQPQTNPADGQPMPGTTSATGFRVVTWPDGMRLPDDPDDLDRVRLVLDCALAGVSLAGRIEPAPVVDVLARIDVAPELPPELARPVADEQPDGPGGPGGGGAWGFNLHFCSGEALRTMFGPQVAGMLGVEQASANEPNQHRGICWIGDLSGTLSAQAMVVLDDKAAQILSDTAPADIANDDSGLAHWMVRCLRLEDEWTGWWTSALKQTVNPPSVHLRYRVEWTCGGATGVSQTFVVRQGLTTEQYMDAKTEQALKTSMQRWPSLAITGYVPRRRDERNHQAITVHYCDRPVPGLEHLVARPGEDDGALAMCRILANRAFDAARLARPEVTAARCLTRGMGSQVWELDVLLFGGVTITEVRKQADKLRAALGCGWLRVVSGDGIRVRLVAGAEPAGARFVDKATRDRVAGIEWENVWLTARQTGEGGALPQLLERSTLPANDLVERMVFRLPPGLTVPGLRMAKKVLETAAVKGFVEIRAVRDHPDRVEVLVADTSPMPFPAPYDFDHPCDESGFGFGAAVTGEPLEWRFKDMAHLGLFGTSGSGKSAAAQALLFGALAGGGRCFVIDAQKKAADFQFALDRLAGVATTVLEACALLEFIRRELVTPLFELNAEYGVGSTRELPADVRPPQMFVFVDEFFGLVSAGKMPSNKPVKDPELEAERIRQMQEWEARRRIAFLVGRLAAESRSAGLHLVLMTQKMTSDMLGGAGGGGSLADLKTNLNRILLGKANAGERASGLRDALNCPDPGEYVPKGRGVFEPVESAAELVQFWYASPDQYRAALVERVAPVEPVDFSGYLPDENENAEFVIVEEGGVGVESQPVDDLGELDLGDLDLGELDLGDLDLAEPVPPVPVLPQAGSWGSSIPTPPRVPEESNPVESNPVESNPVESAPPDPEPGDPVESGVVRQGNREVFDEEPVERRRPRRRRRGRSGVPDPDLPDPLAALRGG